LHLALLGQSKTTIVLVQYVPHMYGLKGMNLLFTLWLWLFCPRKIWVMFHEVNYPLRKGQSWKESILAVVQTIMAAMTLRSASKVFVSVPSWIPLLKRLKRPLPPPEWLPIPSNLPPGNAEVAERIRCESKSKPSNWLVGHFGTFGDSVMDLLQPILKRLLREPKIDLLLVGRGSREFTRQLLIAVPESKDRVRHGDSLDSQAISDHLLACDLLVQPYRDGANSRRTTLMAGLSVGVPVVSNRDVATEPIWESSGAIGLGDSDAEQLTNLVRTVLCDPVHREALVANARQLYATHFAIEVIGKRLLQLASEG
jgi:hypothetical protein